MNKLIEKIIKQVFKTTPTLVEEIKGKGRNNLAFKVVINNTPVILRLNNNEQVFELYKKERWCAEVVKDAGIPTPKILELGIIDGYAFSIQEFIEGVSGLETPDKLNEIWFTLGKYAGLINKIPASDFQLDYKKIVSGLFANDYFIIKNLFSRELSEKIFNRLKETYFWKFSPTLCHGNLHPSNVIIGSTGVIYIIDWETATGNMTPHSELAEIYTWNTGKENISHFIKGYGLKEDQVKNMIRDIQTLILLRRVHVIVRKISNNNDWKEDKYINETIKTLDEISDYQQNILFMKNL